MKNRIVALIALCVAWSGCDTTSSPGGGVAAPDAASSVAVEVAADTVEAAADQTTDAAASVVDASVEK